MESCLKFFLPSLIFLLQLCDLVASVAQWHTASDGNRYLIEVDLKYNWLQSFDECARRGLQLVEIENETKNNNLVALIRSAYGKSRDLWLGYHDEFNSDKNTNRPFYKLSTGEKLPFTKWKAGEPNNVNGAEHCVLIWSPTDFQWNDEGCSHPYGFICEEHHLTTKYQKDMNAKRTTANQKNNQLASQFSITQSELKRVNSNAQSEADKVLVELEQSTQQIIAELKESLNEIVKKKPYLEAVIADVGHSFGKVVAEKEQEHAQVASEARQSMANIHQNVEISSNKAASHFSEELTRNNNEIDMLFVG